MILMFKFYIITVLQDSSSKVVLIIFTNFAFLQSDLCVIMKVEFGRRQILKHDFWFLAVLSTFVKYDILLKQYNFLTMKYSNFKNIKNKWGTQVKKKYTKISFLSYNCKKNHEETSTHVFLQVIFSRIHYNTQIRVKKCEICKNNKYNFTTRIL